MIEPEDRIAVHNVFRARVQRKYAIPFLMDYVQAGFPSPAENGLLLPMGQIYTLSN